MENVVHCGYCRDDIDRALETALVDPAFAKRVAGCKRPFGDGRAYQRIVDVLKSAKLGPRLFDKRMTV